MSSTDAFLAPVMTEILLTGLARLRTDGPPAALQLGSPWLSDVPLFPGIFAGSFPFLLPGVGPQEVSSVSSFIHTWVRDGGKATLLVQGYGPKEWPRKANAHYNEQELELLARALDAGAEVLIAHDYHDKFITVPDVVVSGSANVTYSGIYLNRERLSIHNRSSAPNDYVSAEAVCNNHIATAQAAGICSPPFNPHGRASSASLAEIRRCYRSSWT